MARFIKKTQIAPLVYLMQKILFRMTLFSFFLLTASCLLYGAGNYQKFLDATQLFVLRELIFMAITLFFFSLVSIVFTVLDSLLSKFFAAKKVYVIIFYVFCIALSVFTGTTARGLLVLTTSS